MHAPERDQEKQHSLLVHMPAKEEARHCRQNDRVQEALVRRVGPELDEEDGRDTEGDGEAVAWGDIGQDAKGRGAD